MIKELIKNHKDGTAKVLLDNVPSQKVFEKNNFTNYKSDEKFKYYKL